MSLPNVGNPVRGSLQDNTRWYLEWTYTDGSGAVLLDGAKSDQDERVTTPVADGTVGITLIRFPKCTRVRIDHLSIETPNVGTAADYRHAFPSSVDPAAGSMSVRILAANGGAVNSDPVSGSRGRLHLTLEAV